MSRTAMNLRPVSLRSMFLASTASTATTHSVSMYLSAGVSNA